MVHPVPASCGHLKHKRTRPRVFTHVIGGGKRDVACELMSAKSLDDIARRRFARLIRYFAPAIEIQAHHG